MNREDESLPEGRGEVTFRYKRRPWLRLDGETLNQIAAMAQIQCTQKEAAAVLGVCARAFEAFLAKHEEARDAWKDGKQNGRASLRRLLWKQAQTDEGQARFLAKDKRWLGMEPEAPQQVNNITVIASPEQRIARLIELQAKVIAATPESREVVLHERDDEPA